MRQQDLLITERKDINQVDDKHCTETCRDIVVCAEIQAPNEDAKDHQDGGHEKGNHGGKRYGVE